MTDARVPRSDRMAALSARRKAATAKSPPTPRQREVLELLIRGIAETGVQPCRRQLCEALGLASVNAIKGFLNSLELKGYVACPHEPRAVRILRNADGSPFRGFAVRGSEGESN